MLSVRDSIQSLQKSLPHYQNIQLNKGQNEGGHRLSEDAREGPELWAPAHGFQTQEASEEF